MKLAPDARHSRRPLNYGARELSPSAPRRCRYLLIKRGKAGAAPPTLFPPPARHPPARTRPRTNFIANNHRRRARGRPRAGLGEEFAWGINPIPFKSSSIIDPPAPGAPRPADASYTYQFIRIIRRLLSTAYCAPRAGSFWLDCRGVGSPTRTRFRRSCAERCVLRCFADAVASRGVARMRRDSGLVR